MKRFRDLCVLPIFILMVTISDCSTVPRPFDYQPDNELKKGPGLFSGEEEAFIIYRKQAEPEKVSETGDKNEQTNR